MIVYLHSSDSRYAGRTFGRHIGMDVRHVAVPEWTEPEDVAGVVVAELNEEGGSSPEAAVDLLVIVADGGAGYFTLSGEPDDEYFWIDRERAGQFAAPFASLLKPKNELGQGVEIHGCSPAAAEIDLLTGKVIRPDDGRRFLGVLAAAFGHQVKASADAGPGGLDENYEDSLVEARPSDVVDGETEIRVVRDMGSNVGFGTASRLEGMFGID